MRRGSRAHPVVLFGQLAFRAAATYLATGLVVTAISTAVFYPLLGMTWQTRASEAVHLVLTWPRLLPFAAEALREAMAAPFFAGREGRP